MTDLSPKRVLPLSHPYTFISTFGGVGLIPVIPGTFGSAAAYPLWLILALVSMWMNLSTFTFHLIVLLVTIILFGLGTHCTDQYARYTGKIDPGEAVIDEVCGQMIVLLYASLFLNFDLLQCLSNPFHWPHFLSLSIPFILFRIFDIWKPWPIRWFDQNVKGGLGIMIDDVVAAVLAMLVHHGFSLWIGV